MACRSAIACLLLHLCTGTLLAQGVSVSGHVRAAGRGDKSGDVSGMVVWLTPISNGMPQAPSTGSRFRLIQKEKQFAPHILVVPVGSAVEFPNLDPWFHNVFSLFEGKRFDLGLYEAGTTRTVHFDKAGVSYIFCNIHPEMSAVVVAVPTHLYGISNRRGVIHIASVPPGKYAVHFWQENIARPDLDKLSRELNVSETASSFGDVPAPQHDAPRLSHKNKYGEDYPAPSPSSPVYTQ